MWLCGLWADTDIYLLRLIELIYDICQTAIFKLQCSSEPLYMQSLGNGDTLEKLLPHPIKGLYKSQP